MPTEYHDSHQRCVRELEQPHDDDRSDEQMGDLYRGRHHARYHRPDTTYHIISRTLLGYCLMRPDPWFNDMPAGVIGRAQQLFQSVEIYAYAFLSSHFHIMLRGRPDQIPAFVGFIKREISRRLGQHIEWPGPMWDGRYLATALPSPEDELRCMEYVLANAVKEGLTARCHHWPGLHAAKQLRTGATVEGSWFDGTRYGRALDQHRRKGRPTAVNRKDFTHTCRVVLSVLPAWRHLSDDDRRREVLTMLDRIEKRAAQARNGARPLGVRGVLATPRNQPRPMPPPGSFEERRKMICWADPKAVPTREYLDGYWDFQRAFRAASDDFLAGHLDVTFPPACFRPSTYRPPPPDPPQELAA